MAAGGIAVGALRGRRYPRRMTTTPDAQPSVPAGAATWRAVGWIALAVVLVGHLCALYAPGSPEPAPVDIPGLDKVVHVALFALPAFLIGRLTRASWPLWLLLAHAPISELIQHAFIPLRTGDPLDLLADLAGVALGTWLATRRDGRRRARRSSTTPASP